MRPALVLFGALLATTSCNKPGVSSSGNAVTVTRPPGGGSGASATATVPTAATPTTPTTPSTPSTPTTPSTPPASGTASKPGTTAGEPVVTWATPEVKGEIDDDALHKAADALLPDILACYRSALERAPGYTATISLRFIVTPQGKTLSADLAEPVPDGAFGTCLTTAAKKAKLPKAKGGKNAIVTQPYQLAQK